MCIRDRVKDPNIVTKETILVDDVPYDTYLPIEFRLFNSGQGTVIFYYNYVPKATLTGFTLSSPLHNIMFWARGAYTGQPFTVNLSEISIATRWRQI